MHNGKVLVKENSGTGPFQALMQPDSPFDMSIILIPNDQGMWVMAEPLGGCGSQDVVRKLWSEGGDVRGT